MWSQKVVKLSVLLAGVAELLHPPPERSRKGQDDLVQQTESQIRNGLVQVQVQVQVRFQVQVNVNVNVKVKAIRPTSTSRLRL
jgi:hypothetical protein